MKGDKRAKGKPARRARSARPPEAKGTRDISSSHARSLGIQPEDVSLTRMLETLKPHDHLCLIYESAQEWRAAAIPFISIGLKRGEKCIYIVDTSTADEIRTYLGEEGLDLASVVKAGQLVILHETQAYTREGSFDPDRMIALLISETEKAIAEGYPALRVTGEMTWVLRGYPGAEKLLEYEAKLNRDFFPKYPCLAICQYDRWKFDPEIIKGVVMTHPLLIKGDQVYHNFYYIPPEEFLNEKRAELEVQHWLNNLEREQRIHETLRKSEEKLRSIFETTPAGIGISVQHVLKEVNPCLCVMTGYSRDELLNKNIRLVYQSDEEFQRVRQELYEQLANTGGGTLEVCWRRKNGEVLNVFMQASPLNPLDLSQGIVFAVADITERKRLEEYLEKERQEFKLIIDSSPIIVFYKDKKGRFVRVNKAFAEALQVSEEEFLGKTVFDLYSAQIAQVMTNDDQEVLKSGRPKLNIIEQYESISGMRWVRTDKIPIFGENGIAVGLVGFAQDITEGKKAEEELQKHREHLEELVKDRTRELEEANVRLQEMDRLKSVFLASMSHELRTPLNSIIGFTGIILQGMSGEINQEQRKQLTMVKNSANHLLSLINDVLDVSKIEAGRVELSPEDMRLDDVVKELAEAFSPAASEKDLELLTEVPEGILLLSDRRRVKQVLMNLVSNAIKFTDRGSVRIAARVARDGNAEIRVIDTGIGIKKEDTDKLFQPFQQVGMSLTRSREGTGLGLHLAKRLATLLGGDISAKSEYGKGSEFTFTIPLRYKEG